MESGLFNVAADMTGMNSAVIDRFALQSVQASLDQFNSSDLNSQNQVLARYSLPSTLQSEPISDLHADLHMVNQGPVLDSDALVMSLGSNVVRDPSPGSSQPVSSAEFQGQFVSAPLASFWAERGGLQENLNNLAISGRSIYPLEVLRSYVSDCCSGALNSSFASSMIYGCDEVLDNMYGRDDFERFAASSRAGFQSYSSVQPVSWISSNSVNLSTDNPHGSSKSCKELSLSLATSHPSMLNGMSITDQCSEIDCSGNVTRNCLKEMRTRSELQISSNNKDLSLTCNSNRASQFSQVISGSRYLNVIQEILAQIASYSIENLEQTSSFTSGTETGANMPFSSSYPIGRQGSEECPCADDTFGVQMDPALQKQALGAKKTQLLTLLQAVDDRYNQCLDEIHTVVSAFHAATELDPQIHACFALQTISFLYKNLRERISNQILAMGAYSDSSHCTRDMTGGSFEATYFQKQWTLQQLKKKDQLWRPQRGLPERSVSVLRAWMFQNFLHPYPKDAEKHLLAVKSGLTRSQVSNWFINARVRLWKPMIEEMYAEMNRRKACDNEDGTNSNNRGHISTGNTKLNGN